MKTKGRRFAVLGPGLSRLDGVSVLLPDLTQAGT